jgi:hypothetical protein
MRTSLLYLVLDSLHGGGTGDFSSAAHSARLPTMAVGTSSAVPVHRSLGDLELRAAQQPQFLQVMNTKATNRARPSAGRKPTERGYKFGPVSL